MKKITLGVIIGVAIAIAITTFGSSNSSNVSDTSNYIEANYTVNDIIVNGVSSGIGSSAFISNGTTYVPLRAIAELLGIEVYWDSSNRNITINSSSPSEEQLASPTDLETISSDTSQTTTSTTDSSTTSTTTSNSVTVTADEAKQQALSLVGGGTIITFKEDLYYKDGPIRKYEIEVLYNDIIYEIDIDAYTGNVKKFDAESIYD